MNPMMVPEMHATVFAMALIFIRTRCALSLTNVDEEHSIFARFETAMT